MAYEVNILVIHLYRGAALYTLDIGKHVFKQMEFK
jgi:hypothetical protein